MSKTPNCCQKKEAHFYCNSSRASECEFDKLGRVNIPNVLRIEGKLEKECIIVGVGDHVEIWNQNIWDDYYDANKDNFDEISESLEGFEL
ncbi:MAG: division/cell wall cluster transcriptional repressor MraZ [Thomasclavelia spiroformis]